MIIETIIEKNMLEVPKEILEKFKGKKVVKWNVNGNNEVKLEFSEISSECQKLAQDLDKLNKEIDDGNFATMDMDFLAKELNL
ncbi:MAG: hypothetical protein LBB45_05375 [Methanobrevibacter sp.]|jgi:hypothetical protein|nr:hypothetical protein [Candidatus Methanovirga basalitermitum]